MLDAPSQRLGGHGAVAGAVVQAARPSPRLAACRQLQHLLCPLPSPHPHPTHPFLSTHPTPTHFLSTSTNPGACWPRRVVYLFACPLSPPPHPAPPFCLVFFPKAVSLMSAANEVDLPTCDRASMLLLLACSAAIRASSFFNPAVLPRFLLFQCQNWHLVSRRLFLPRGASVLLSRFPGAAPSHPIPASRPPPPPIKPPARSPSAYQTTFSATAGGPARPSGCHCRPRCQHIPIAPSGTAPSSTAPDYMRMRVGAVPGSTLNFNLLLPLFCSPSRFPPTRPPTPLPPTPTPTHPIPQYVCRQT